MQQRVIIVGAGHAGMNVARSLREQGWTGDVLLVTEEATAPYERPPLSKGILTGDKLPNDIVVPPSDWLEAMNISFLPKTRIVKIEPHEKTIKTKTKEHSPPHT